MTSFFYVVSIAFHTSVPVFQKCMDTSRKTSLWLRVQPLVHLLQLIFCFHPVSVDCDQLALHAVWYDSGDRGSTVVKVLCYKSEGHWFDPSWCRWIFY